MLTKRYRNTGIYAQVSQYASGYRSGNVSPRVTFTKQGAWSRLQTTVTVLETDTRQEVGIGFAADTFGTVHVDDIQFERNIPNAGSVGAGSYNLLANSLLTNFSAWTNQGFSAASRPADAPASAEAVIHAVGSATAVKQLSQTVAVSGKKGDVFIAGGWLKANAVPLDHNDAKPNTPLAEVTVTFYNGTAQVGDPCKVSCNTAVTDWQYLLLKATAPGNYTKAVYTFRYAYTPGTVLFASPFLYKENYGQSYTYDQNGNLVSGTDATETMATFAFQDNALTASFSPSGSSYTYTRDETTDNIRYAFANSGQKVDFTYNESGDATSMTVTDLAVLPQIENGHNCYIINAKTGRALGSYGLQAGKFVYVGDHFRVPEQQWEVAIQSGNIYTIRAASNWNLGFSRTASSGVLATISNDYAAIANACKFKFVPNGNGTYRILTGSSGYTEYLTVGDPKFEKGYYKTLTASTAEENDPALDWYLLSINTSKKIITSAEYSADGNYLLSSTDAAGNKVTYTYDPTTGLLSTAVDANGTVTTYTHDSMRRTQSVSSNGSSVFYAYAADDLSEVRVNNGEVVYHFTYDQFGRSQSVAVGDQTLATYEYTGQNMTRQTYGNGDAVLFSYDALDRVKQKEYSNGSGKGEYFYDPNGNLYRVKDTFNQTNTFNTYDLAGRLVESTLLNQNSSKLYARANTVYEDKKGTVKEQNTTLFDATNAPYHNVLYQYTYGDPAKGQNPDAVYRLMAGGRQFSYTYDGLGRLTGKALSLVNPVSETFTYRDNANGTTTPLVQTHKDTTGITHTYTYDANGNITSETTSNGINKSYVYDSLNQLVRCNDSALNTTVLYTYDLRGNILSKKTYPYTVGEVDETTAVTKTYSYGNTNWKDLLTSIDGTTINYDEIGNPLNWTDGKSFTWTRGKSLASVTDGNTTVNYTYNADGLRTAKSGSKNTQYFAVSGTYVGEKTVINGTTYYISYVYDENGAPAGINVNGSAYYFSKNLQGDIIAIHSYTGAVVGRYSYDEYGKLISITDANGNAISSNTSVAILNPFRYRGYFYDDETGFYLTGTRYYDPEIGRFISPDTTDVITATPMALTDKNLYAYCDNNPVVRADHSGEFWNYVIGGVVGAVVGGVSAAISGGNWKAIALGAGVGAVGGLLAASGVPAGFQIVAGGLLSGGNNLATQTLVEGKSLQEVDWIDVGIDTAIGAGTSALSYGVTRNASKAADKIICKGANKVVKGQQSLLSGSRYGKGAIKKGTAIMNSGIKQMNTVRGTSSVVGSTSGGFLTSVKSFFKRLFR